MPISKSAIKSYRTSEKKRERNKVLEQKLVKSIKKASKENINDVISLIDKSAKVKILSKNKAARVKSRLMKKFGTPKATKQTPAKTLEKKTATKKTVAKKQTKPLAAKSTAKKSVAKKSK